MRRRYSRELRNLIYYEYDTFSVIPNLVVYKGRKHSAVPGILLSSFRPVRVLLTYKAARKSITSAIRKFVAVKSTANDNVIISSNDKICNIYDVSCLKNSTGKGATIPERIAMRLATLPPEEFVKWRSLRKLFYAMPLELDGYDYDDTGYDGSIASKLVVLALYYVKNKLGVGMFTFDLNSIFVEAVPVFFKSLRYGESLYINHHRGFIVIVPKPVRSVTYHSLYKAYTSYVATCKEIESLIKNEQPREVYGYEL